jgi:hypothetical protein
MERESRMVSDKIRRGVEGQLKASLWVLLILLQKCRNGSLLRLVVVVLIDVVLVTTPW